MFLFTIIKRTEEFKLRFCFIQKRWQTWVLFACLVIRIVKSVKEEFLFAIIILRSTEELTFLFHPEEVANTGFACLLQIPN